MNANLIGTTRSRSSTSVLRTNNDDTGIMIGTSTSTNGTIMLACSPVQPPTSSPTSPSLRSLQARLTAARTAHNSHTIAMTNEQNAFILQYKNGVAVDENGYPLGQYQKKFLDQLKLKSLITSVRIVSYCYNCFLVCFCFDVLSFSFFCLSLSLTFSYILFFFLSRSFDVLLMVNGCFYLFQSTTKYILAMI